MYGPSPATAIPSARRDSRQFLNMNPPHFHLLMLPFAVLGPMTALVLWAVVNLIALFLSLRAVARELRIEWTRERIMWGVVAIILCSATGGIVVTGQLTFLLLLPVTFAWIAARQGDWNKSAALLGACASVKPFLGIFLIYLILRRDIKPVATMVVSGVLCGVAGLGVFWVECIHQLAGSGVISRLDVGTHERFVWRRWLAGHSMKAPFTRQLRRVRGSSSRSRRCCRLRLSAFHFVSCGETYIGPLIMCSAFSC